MRLVTQSQVGDQRAVTLDVFPLEIFQQPTSASNHLEQPAAAVVVLLVRIEVTTQVVDSRCEQRDLDRGTPDVTVMELVLLNYFGLVEHVDLSLRMSLSYKGSGPSLLNASLLQPVKLVKG
jgi:hypothetical protein